MKNFLISAWRRVSGRGGSLLRRSKVSGSDLPTPAIAGYAKAGGWILAAATIMLGIVLVMAPPALAADYYWTNNASGNFTNAANWDLGSVPGAADNANFTNNTSYTVTHSSSVQNNNAYYNAPGGTVTHNIGGSWTLTNSFIVRQGSANFPTVYHSAGAIAVTNTSRTAVMKIGEAGYCKYTLYGGAIEADHFFKTNGAAWLDWQYGNLTIYGDSEIIGDVQVGSLVGILDPGIAIWDIRGGISRVQGNTTIGRTAGGYGGEGSLIVSGAGTVFSNTGTLYWQSPRPNPLIVSNGGTVYAGTFQPSSPGKTSIVTGAGSTLITPELQMKANGGVEEVLQIENGGQLRSSNAFIGYILTPYKNHLIVTGSGSMWSNVNNLIIGYNGDNVAQPSNNKVSVMAGAALFGPILTVGLGSQWEYTPNRIAWYNYLLVDGTGSIVRLSGLLSVGKWGPLNTLTVRNGGKVFSGQGIVGDGSSGSYSGSVGSNNTATVTGSGSIWSNSGSFTVGSFGRANRLVITDGGIVYNTEGRLGDDATATDYSSAVVSGAGSLWQNSANLYLGYSGHHSLLTITTNGQVKAVNVTVGLNATSTGNVVTISSGSLTVSNASGSATLDVRRGTLTLGSNGTVWCGDLVLTNSSSNILRFEVDGQTGAGNITVTNQFSVTNALLQVAVTNSYRNANLVLATYRTRSGSFASTNITVTTDRGGAWVEQTSTNIVLHLFTKGTIVSVH